MQATLKDNVNTRAEWSQKPGIETEIRMTALNVERKTALCELVVRLASQKHLACSRDCTKVKCPHPCPPVMVPLLVYCYAVGVYGSAEIEELSLKDQNIQRLCGDKWIQPWQIRCFRRRYRSLLRSCLAELIRELRGGTGAIRESLRLLGEAAAAHGPDACDSDLEAEERIRLAILVDSAEMDE